MTQPAQVSDRVATCPLCGHDAALRQFVARDRIHKLPGEFAIHRCARCHAYFIQPWLSDDQLAQYYPAQYRRYNAARSLDKKNYRGYWQRLVLEERYGYPRSTLGSSIYKKAAGLVLSLFTARRVVPYRGEGKILDVGCGGGSYLYRLKQWGWQTYGIEPNPTGVEQARGLGLEVQQGTLHEGRYPTGFFDVVRLSNVFEHLPNPKEVLHEIRRILKPDGIVYITVPNTRSLVFWLFQENWYALDAPRHVISYSPKTLRMLCDSTGFAVAGLNFRAGPFNCTRSLGYFFEAHERWPAWLSKIRWEHHKAIRRLLKPIFLVVDFLGFGDFMHATLRPR